MAWHLAAGQEQPRIFGCPSEASGDSGFGSSNQQLAALHPHYNGMHIKHAQMSPQALSPEQPGGHIMPGGAGRAVQASDSGAEDDGQDGDSFADCLSLEELQSVYHLPSKEAADKLGISLSRLKRSCRVHKVVRWPHRKLSSLVNLQDTIRNDKNMKTADKQRILEAIARELVLVKGNPDHAIDSKLDDIRQAKYKLKYYHKTKHIQAAAAAQARKRRSQTKPAAAPRNNPSASVLPSSSSHWTQSSWGTLSTEVGGVAGTAEPMLNTASPFGQHWAPAGSGQHIAVSRQTSSRYLVAGSGFTERVSEETADNNNSSNMPGMDWSSMPSMPTYKSSYSEHSVLAHRGGAVSASLPAQLMHVGGFAQLDCRAATALQDLPGGAPFLDELQVVAASSSVADTAENGGLGSQFSHGVIDTAVVPQPRTSQGGAEADDYACGGEHGSRGGRRNSSFAGNERLPSSDGSFGPSAPAPGPACYLPDRHRFLSEPAPNGGSFARRSANGTTVHLPSLNLVDFGSVVPSERAAMHWSAKEHQHLQVHQQQYHHHHNAQQLPPQFSSEYMPGMHPHQQHYVQQQPRQQQQLSELQQYGGGGGFSYISGGSAAYPAGGVMQPRKSSTNSSPMAPSSGLYPDPMPPAGAHHNACYDLDQKPDILGSGAGAGASLKMQLALQGSGPVGHGGSGHHSHSHSHQHAAAAAGHGDLLGRVNSGGAFWRSNSAGTNGGMPNGVLDAMLFANDNSGGALW